MEYRTFGRTGWQVSAIGFGTWQLGGTWGKVDDDESIDTLHYAFDCGVNFIDTAAAYGKGHSEDVVGRALREYKAGSHKLYVATKVTPPHWPDGPCEPCMAMRGHLPAPFVRSSVEGSLRRLGVERIDLLQLHAWVPSGCMQLDWLETLNELRLEGKIDQIGVSLCDIVPETGVGLAKLGLVSSIQTIFNLFEQEPVDELFPAAAQSGTAIISRVPYDSGALTGSWGPDTYDTWAEDDLRKHMYREGRYTETLRRVKSLQDVCASYYPTLAEAAMRYSMHHQAVDTVVAGMRSKHEVDLNLPYADGQSFPSDLMDKIRPHRWKHVFYS